MKGNQRTIFLAGDSTVQSYRIDQAPQCGWGEYLIRYLSGEDYSVSHPQDYRFSNVVQYEAAEWIVVNAAMAGRSVRRFLEEGRFADMAEHFKSGDILLMQFGHNDANRDKPERFATPSEFAGLLYEEMILPAIQKKVHPVLVTPIAMLDFDEEDKCRISFPEYREAMLRLAEEKGISCIDLGLLTAEYNTSIGKAACRSLYLWTDPKMFSAFPEGSEDTAHLQAAGAIAYAKLLSDALTELKTENVPAE